VQRFKVQDKANKVEGERVGWVVNFEFLVLNLKLNSKN
jgi:hypothetical protein